MKKKMILKHLLVCAVLLVCASAALARTPGAETLKAGAVHKGDAFVSGRSFTNDGEMRGDLFFWTEQFHSSGRVTGDIIGAGQYVNVPGTVEGSVIGGGEFVNIDGTVRGNVRTLGKDVVLNGTVRKNVIVCGSSVTMNAAVDGSLIACGMDVTLDGTVMEKTRIFGRTIVLKGEFMGDVSVNDVEIDENNEELEKELRDADVSLTVMPGTVIHGTLTYRGLNADISDGARVKDFQWIKPKISPEPGPSIQVKESIWKFITMLFVTAILFLLGILLHRKSPALFSELGNVAARKPFHAVGRGFIAVLSVIPAVIVMVLLLALSVIISPAFGLMFGLTAAAAYTLLFYFSVIPAAIWLGNLIMREKSTANLRFFIGLVLINGTIFIMNLLAGFKNAEEAFSALAFIIRFSALLLGSGAILITLWNLARRNGDEVVTQES